MKANGFFSGIIRDITERSEMTRALSVSEHRMEAILESANDAIISIDDHGGVVLWNRGAAEMFGYSSEDMIGEPGGRGDPCPVPRATRRGY